MYEVIVRFKDLQDGDHIYEAGDKFPRDGVKPSRKRIAELSGKENKRGIPLIKKIVVEEPKDADADGGVSGT